MTGDTPKGGDYNHESKGNEDHRMDHQLPVAESPDEGAGTNGNCVPDVEHPYFDDLDDDAAFDSMIQVIRKAQCGGVEPTFFSIRHGLRPDIYTTPAPELMIKKDGDACINPYSIAKQVPRQTFSPATNQLPFVDVDEENLEIKNQVIVDDLLPQQIFTMETQAIATMVLLHMNWYIVGDYPCYLLQPLEETCLAILFLFDKVGMHTTAREDLPLDRKAAEGNVKRAYIDVVKNFLFKYSLFEAIAKTRRIADDIARWKKHRPMLFDDPNNVLEGWEL